MKKILVNRIKTPDGTILVSKHRHDYVTYVDENGLEYMVDGGTAYLRRNVHKIPMNKFVKFVVGCVESWGFILKARDLVEYRELSIYYDDDTPFELIRQHVYRGGRGKDGKQPLKFVLLKDMSNGWVDNLIIYEEERRPDNFYLPWYRLEQIYRLKHNIIIEENE